MLSQTGGIVVKKVKKREESELIHRREKYIEYQNRRKEKLDKLGEYKLSLRLERSDYDKLADLCENLGYRRPVSGKYNLVETYSEVMKYLLRISESLISYQPKSEEAIGLLHLHQFVTHLKHDKNSDDENILQELKTRGVKIPLSSLRNEVKETISDELQPLDNKVTSYDHEKFIEYLLSEKLVVKKIMEIDKKFTISSKKNG